MDSKGHVPPGRDHVLHMRQPHPADPRRERDPLLPHRKSLTRRPKGQRENNKRLDGYTRTDPEQSKRTRPQRLADSHFGRGKPGIRLGAIAREVASGGVGTRAKSLTVVADSIPLGLSAL